MTLTTLPRPHDERPASPAQALNRRIHRVYRHGGADSPALDRLLRMKLDLARTGCFEGVDQ